MAERRISLPGISTDYLPFTGGLDQVSDSWKVKPGALRQSQNYEIDVEDGYKDIVGYERFDGQAAPSAAAYAILDVTITGSFSVGDTITGATSTFTAVVLAVVMGGTQDYLVITKYTGTFVAETLNVSGSPEGTCSDAQVIGGASTQLLNAQYLNLAADNYRADIAAIPGSGQTRGVFRLNSILYGIRNDAAGTAAAMYKQSAAGWVLVNLGFELSFTSGGITEIAEGDTITGATSACTAVITRVVLDSGTWAGGDAAGRFIFASQSTNFQAENINVGASTNLATIAGDSTAITLQPSGSYDLVKKNLVGNQTDSRIYGCDGVNQGFEFDGTVYVPIETGMTTDAPEHVIVHKNHLFFSFGSSVQHSGIGTPYNFTIVLGAAELSAGDNVTAFKIEPGSEGNSALGIYCNNKINILYGSSAADWNMVEYREEVGAYENTVQEMASTLFLDDVGITTLGTTQAYGNFVHSAISNLVKPFINENRGTVTASCVVRNKNQYRLFFSDGYALYVTMNGKKLMGIMPILFPDVVRCIWAEEATDGTEVIYFGSDDGFIYQMEKGTSFDGDAIEAYFTMHFHHSNSIDLIKRYVGALFETSGTGYASFDCSYELGYASIKISQPSSETIVLPYTSVYWDSFVWDAFTWDGVNLSPTRKKLKGAAENISITIRKNSDYFTPVRFSGVILKILKRRIKRD